MTTARDGASRRQINLNGTTVQVQEYGDSEAEPVLALHSAGLDGGEFNEFALSLIKRGRYRVIALDYRGHGPSAVGTRVSLADIAHDVCTLIEVMRLDGVHLIGHSVGGIIAGLASTECPARLLSLTIVSSPPRGQSMYLERAREARNVGMEAVAEPTLARWFSQDELQQEGPGVQYARTTLRRTPLESWSSLWESFAHFKGFSPSPGVPLLCITGENDQSTPPSVVEHTRKSLDGITPLEVLPGGSHQIFLTQPISLARHWDTWVAEYVSRNGG